MTRSSQVQSASRALDAFAGAAKPRKSFGYCCVLRLALRAAAATFSPESTPTTGH
nr:hypothetical protein [uncultured bacterium]